MSTTELSAIDAYEYEFPYEKIKILVQAAAKADFTEVDVLPPGGAAEQPWASVADVDGDGKPELLLAQKNFLRAEFHLTATV